MTIEQWVYAAYQYKKKGHTYKEIKSMIGGSKADFDALKDYMIQMKEDRIKRTIQVQARPVAWAPFAKEHMFEKKIEVSKYLLSHPDKVLDVVDKIVREFEKSDEFRNADSWFYSFRVKQPKTSGVYIPNYWKPYKRR